MFQMPAHSWTQQQEEEEGPSACGVPTLVFTASHERSRVLTAAEWTLTDDGAAQTAVFEGLRRQIGSD